MGAGDADTAAGEDYRLDWGDIGSRIDGGIEIDIGAWRRISFIIGVNNWRSGGIGVNFWRSSSFVIDITVSIGRDGGVGAASGCDECGAGRCVWRGASCGCGAECWGRD